MPDLTTYALALVPLAIAGGLIVLYLRSIAGNENLEIQWRLASLREAKVVIANYHKHLADNGLIKAVTEEPAAEAAPTPTPVLPAETPAPEAAKAPGEAHVRVVSSKP